MQRALRGWGIVLPFDVSEFQSTHRPARLFALLSRFLQKEMGKRLAEVIAATSNLHLVTDGKSIFLEDQHDRIIDILKNARQPMFLVSVSDQARRLTETERKPVRMDPGVTSRRSARVG